MKNLTSIHQLVLNFNRLLTLSLTATCTTIAMNLNMVNSAIASSFFPSQNISQNLTMGSSFNSQSNCLQSSQSLTGITQSMTLCSPKNGGSGGITIGGVKFGGSQTNTSSSQVIAITNSSQTTTSNLQTITGNPQTITQISNISSNCLSSSQILNQGSSITQVATMCAPQPPVTVINTGSSFNNTQIMIGNSQSNPVLPTTILPSGAFLFLNVSGGLWFDPPMSPGFRYTMTGDSLFTKILDFPTGIDSDNLFNVFVEDISIGQFSPGQAVDFVALLGHGVKEFTVSGIDPLVDSSNPIAFPIQLDFSTEKASFKQEAISAKKVENPRKVPEYSSTLGLIAFGGFMIIVSRLGLKQKNT